MFFFIAEALRKSNLERSMEKEFKFFSILLFNYNKNKNKNSSNKETNEKKKLKSEILSFCMKYF